ncbi:MAG: TerC family protein [Rhodospirillales bacterium]|nr:TerC family protein [Rhodospirillales bacterium]
MDALFTAASAELFGTPAWMWAGFVTLVIALLAFDLGVLQRRRSAIGVRKGLWLSALYIAVALAFGAGVWRQMGPTSGIEYLTGFLIEKSLALDNVFVIALIFARLGIPRAEQHRVLFWGILGVLVLRALMIGIGAALVGNFGWVLYVFGLFLLLTGIKMLLVAETPPRVVDGRVFRFLSRHLRTTPDLHGNRFFIALPTTPDTSVRVWHATPLFLALVMIECADIVFAIDSVPAIFAITDDPFIVYTSNIFAVLGLRALYFALAAMIHRFRYLKYALALVLVFIGGKILMVDFVGKLPAAASLSVTFALLTGGILVSLARTARGPRTQT